MGKTFILILYTSKGYAAGINIAKALVYKNARGEILRYYPHVVKHGVGIVSRKRKADINLIIHEEKHIVINPKGWILGY